MKAIKFFALFLITLLFTLQTFAFFETAESGEIPRVGKYKLSFMPQFKLSNGNGMNFTSFFDSAVNEESSVRVLLGLGDTDFYTSGSFKWIPVPDYKNQPAIGGKVEVLYGRESNDSLVSFRFHPIISKKLEIDYGFIIPYGSIPVSFTTYRNQTETQFNLVFGSEFRSPDYENWEFGSELGLNGNKSFTYISVWATIFMDEEKGFNITH